MGRIRIGLVKITGTNIYNKYKDKFSVDFDNNKKSLDEVATINSKKLRNIIAGYIVGLVKKDRKRRL
tara:strand:- start:368 stop:568 length:201 start_codon:yes stop_codon:yes gene_type:complete